MPDPLQQVILITGCRDWTDKDMIRIALKEWADKRVLLIHGDCRGADKLSGAVAEEFKFQISTKPADWNTYGRAAGPIRNKEMVMEALGYRDSGIPTVVVAFHDNLEQSKGTRNCVTQAQKVGLEVRLWKHD